MGSPQTDRGYVFKGGFPTADTVEESFDEANLNRAIQVYRFFFQTVSSAAIFKGTIKILDYPV